MLSLMLYAQFLTHDTYKSPCQAFQHNHTAVIKTPFEYLPTEILTRLKMANTRLLLTALIQEQAAGHRTLA